VQESAKLTLKVNGAEQTVELPVVVGSENERGIDISSLLGKTGHVVLDPAQARLMPGEILVAPSTDPGWTPLFLTAGGLVMEMGGSMSHGAVVAREYGIPAVVGADRATAAIADGDVVVVDGDAGIVRIVGP